MIDSFRGKHYFLSNFYPSPLCIGGIIYPTVEHAFQALKIPANHPNASQYRQWIAHAKSPMEAKQRGQGVPLRSDWESVKIQLMYEVLKVKFALTKYSKRLLATGDEELAEGNNWGDTFWGTCNGVGRNELGKALMRVRADLQQP